MPDYTSKEKKVFKDRIFEHLDRILEISTKEFLSGYWEKQIKEGHVIEIYHPDQRKCFIQAVETWTDVLLPFFKLVKGTQKDIEDLEKEKDSVLEKFEKGEMDKENYVISKLRIMRKIFRRLNVFLEQSKISKIKTKEGIG